MVSCISQGSFRISYRNRFYAKVKHSQEVHWRLRKFTGRLENQPGRLTDRVAWRIAAPERQKREISAEASQREESIQNIRPSIVFPYSIVC